MIELYAAVLYNFSVIGTTVDATTMPDSFVSEFSPQHKVLRRTKTAHLRSKSKP
jgi:hypothetical protein